jgi:hypothetical protein
VQSTCYSCQSLTKLGLSRYKVKVKVTLEQAARTQRRRGAGWGGWSAPRPGHFTPRKETRYTLYRKLGGPQGQAGRMRKDSPPTGIRSPDRPTRSQSLYRLSYRGPQIFSVDFGKIVGRFHPFYRPRRPLGRVKV